MSCDECEDGIITMHHPTCLYYREECNPIDCPTSLCECYEGPVCCRCGGPEGDDAIKLSPGEMLCLSCHCGDIDRALDARYND